MRSQQSHSLWLGASCWRSLRVSGPLALNLRHGACWNEYWNTERSSFSLFDTNSVGNVSNSRIHEAEGEGGGGGGREGGRGGGREGEVEGGRERWREGGRGGEREGGGRERWREEPCHSLSWTLNPSTT